MFKRGVKHVVIISTRSGGDPVHILWVFFIPLIMRRDTLVFDVTQTIVGYSELPQIKNGLWNFFNGFFNRLYNLCNFFFLGFFNKL